MDQQSSSKRRRIRRSPSPAHKFDYDDDTYEPYVPVAKRRQQKLAKLTSRGQNEQGKRKERQAEIDEREDAFKEEEVKREKARKERTLLVEAQEVHFKKAAEGACTFTWMTCLILWLLDAKKTEGEKAEEADAEILEAIKSRRKLASDMELAKGIQYTESIKTRYAMQFYF